MASATRRTVQPGADIDESRLNRKKGVTERRGEGIEFLGLLLAARLGLGLSLLGGFYLLYRSDAIVGSEHRNLARIEPYVARNRRAGAVGIGNGVLEVGLTHGLNGLVGRHPGGKITGAAGGRTGGDRDCQQKGQCDGGWAVSAHR